MRTRIAELCRMRNPTTTSAAICRSPETALGERQAHSFTLAREGMELGYGRAAGVYSLLSSGSAAEVSRWRRPALSVTYSVARGSREPRPPLGQRAGQGLAWGLQRTSNDHRPGRGACAKSSISTWTRSTRRSNSAIIPSCAASRWPPATAPAENDRRFGYSAGRSVATRRQAWRLEH